MNNNPFYRGACLTLAAHSDSPILRNRYSTCVLCIRTHIVDLHYQSLLSLENEKEGRTKNEWEREISLYVKLPQHCAIQKKIVRPAATKKCNLNYYFLLTFDVPPLYECIVCVCENMYNAIVSKKRCN